MSSTNSMYRARDFGRINTICSTSTKLDASDLCNMEEAVRDFKYYNKGVFFFGGVNYCKECNIIHPNDKCPRCEEPNFFFDDELLYRISTLREAEVIWREGWGMKIRKLDEEVLSLHKKLDDKNKLLHEYECDIRGYKVVIDKLRNQKKLLIKKIKELLAKPHLRHIIFDEDTI